MKKIKKKITQDTLINTEIKSLYDTNFNEIIYSNININIDIDSKSDLFANYSEDKLNQELTNYIEDTYKKRLTLLRCSFKYIKLNKKNIKNINKKEILNRFPIINFNIKNNLFDKSQTNLLKSKITTYYLLKANEEKEKLNRVYITSFLLLLFGILILIIYGLCKIIFDDFLFNEVILIFSWVLIWSSFENYIFLRTDYNKEMLMYYNLYNSKININNKKRPSSQLF